MSTDTASPISSAQLRVLVKELKPGVQNQPRVLMVINGDGAIRERDHRLSVTGADNLGDVTEAEIMQKITRDSTLPQVKTKLQNRLSGANIEIYTPSTLEYVSPGGEIAQALLITGKSLDQVIAGAHQAGLHAHRVSGGITRSKAGDKPSQPEKPKDEAATEADGKK